MKTLEEHNKQRTDRHCELNDNSPKRNNIECPQCGHELLDSNPLMTLTSNPPQKEVHCINEGCGYGGYRIA